MSAEIKPQYMGKVKTNILGFDNLLFGGMDMTADHVVVVIKSDEPIHGTLLGLQILFGIAQSMRKYHCEHKKCNEEKGYKLLSVPYFISSYMDVDRKTGKEDLKSLDDLLLDTIISSCIQQMTVDYVGVPKPEDNGLPKVENAFSEFFFEKKTCNPDLQEHVTGSFMHDSICHDTDALICEEAIYYSNRTNALHLRTAERVMHNVLSDSDEGNIVFKRRFDSYSKYSAPEGEEMKKKLHKMEKKLRFPLVDMKLISCMNGKDFYRRVYKKANEIRQKLNSSPDNDDAEQPYLGIDITGNEHCSDFNYEHIDQLIDLLKDRFKLLVLMVPSSYRIPIEKADLVVELKGEMDNDVQYLLRKVRFTYSRRQATVLGWHIYKHRDYGLEFFPSLHTYFLKRRYLQRALVYTHSPIVSDTYQQYLSRIVKGVNPSDGSAVSIAKDHDFENYLQSRNKMSKENVRSLFTDYSIGESSVSVLEKILLPPMQEDGKKRDDVLDYKGSMTAMIGDGNTYKRFITFGSIFSSALAKEHTLIVLLNKNSDTIRRRLSCPARAKRGENCTMCNSCYKYIHFMDICMANITPDEFVYYLDLQLKTKYEDGKLIRRVVIDDLQIVDHCFPYLLKDTLFLSALGYICRERGVYSYILCDKAAQKAQELRTVADNIICTGRDKKGKLQMFIERFIGFTNTPSKIYCGYIDKVKDLFDCYYKMENENDKRWYYRLNSRRIDDDTVISMNEFWEK